MKRKALLLAFGMLLAIAIWLLIEMRPEPAGYTYQGKTVRQWLEEVLTTNYATASRAFESMGTNAFPDIIRELKKNDSSSDKIIRWVHSRLPVMLKRRWQPPPQQEVLWFSAQMVLFDNHNTSWKIMPDLIQMLQNKKYKSRFPRIIQTIIEIANTRNSESIPSLKALLHDPDLDVRTAAAVALWKIDERQTNIAVTALNEALNSKDPSHSYMRDWAPVYLYTIRPNDESLIPLFIAQLKGTNVGLKFGAISALEQYGTSAIAAVPALTNLLTNSTSQLRAYAMQALKQIDPKNAAQYETP